MNSIDVVDSIAIDAPPAKVFCTVIDYAKTHCWFPQYCCKLIDSDKVYEGCRVKHRLQLSKHIVLSRFTRRIERIEKNHIIEEAYVEGDLLGRGCWEFTPLDNNPNKTRAAYHCKVRANNAMMNLGFKVCGAKAHSIVYQHLLKKLKAECEKAEIDKKTPDPA